MERRRARRSAGAPAPRRHAGSSTVTGITNSRLDEPLDPELGVLKVTAVRPAPGGARVELRDPRHGARSRELPALRRRHGRRLRAPRAAARGPRALRQRRGRRREPPPARLARRGEPGARPWPPGPSPSGRGRARRDERLPPSETASRCPRPPCRVRNCLGRWMPRGARLGLRAALAAVRRDLGGARSDGTAWVTIPGELQTRGSASTSRRRAARASTQTFVAGYSNDYLGLLPHRPRLRTARAMSRAAASTGSGAGSWCAMPPSELLGRLAERREAPPVHAGAS